MQDAVNPASPSPIDPQPNLPQQEPFTAEEVRPEILKFWRHFFKDLFLGTLKNLFIFCTGGFILGVTGLFFFDNRFLEPAEFKGWIEWTVFFLGSVWYVFFGTFHGFLSCTLFVFSNKLAELVLGLHDLLDLLSKEVLRKVDQRGKNIPKHELDERFDKIGMKFYEKLKLKKGFFGSVRRGLFIIILKVLKFLFLNDVLAELKRKPGSQIARSDIESAVRRVGVDVILEPLHDYILLAQALNAAVALGFFLIPIGIVWKFFS